MNSQQKIDRLEDEIGILKLSQRCCEHKWSEPEYTPYQDTELYHTGRYETHGVHQHAIMDSRIINKDRWTRMCIKCGLAEHTENLKALAQPTKYEPEFN